ncbi:uncharacterized protein LOC134272906 [Saccostrea cucullata]|uniref:uncharacterized protein LOC134272906 n=1 Tax=Saccostrea cuccullata TaxID=36930 RepID=UPI002ED6BEB2
MFYISCCSDQGFYKENFRMMNLENVAALVLFFVECYHVCGHLSIAFRIRMLPRKDLYRIRFYILLDPVSGILTTFVFLQRIQWLSVLHFLQQLYYFLFWEKTRHAKKILSWSSLDWTASKLKEEWHFESILGLSFDTGVHVTMAFFLSQYLSTVQIFVCLFLVQCLALVVLCGPWYAWSSPSAIPKWVQKRIRPLSKEEWKTS